MCQIYQSLIHNKIMNVLNLTQPNFHHSQSPKKSNSILNLNQSDQLILLNTEIHKAPQSIRKSMRIGKHRKNYYRNFKSEKERYIINGIQNEQKFQSLAKDFQVNARKISNLSCNIPQNLEISKFIVRQQRQLNTNFLNEIRNKLIKQTQKKLYSPLNKSIQNKRRLSPIKRGSLTIQKKIPKKQLKITFLNIQKVPLSKLYNKIDQQQEQQQIQRQNIIDKWNSSVIQTNFQKTYKDQYKKFSSTTNQFIPKKRVSLSQDIGISSALLKFKKFIPPFQRYYYRDFIWKVAFSYNILLECPKQYQKKFKVFIGKGNNSLLLKSLMKRRGQWWIFTQKYEEANFVWTQIKINEIFRRQQKSQVEKNQQSENILSPLINCKKKKDYELNRKIMNDFQIQKMEEYMSKYRKIEQKLDGTMSKRNKLMKKHNLKCLNLNDIKIHNHLPNNYIIGNKKALYYTMTTYYEKIGQNPFDYLPQTYHIQNGLQDLQYIKFLNSFYPRQKQASKQQRQNSPQRTRTKNIWIVKPGEFTNRGNGINVCLTLDQIKKIVKCKEKHQNGNPKTFIIQSYLDKPFLYQRRKFDIRHYMMITSINGQIKGYWYQIGYIRTTSYEYSIKTNFSSIHLTNDAVQKNLPDYGKYQKGNKLSYEQFQYYLDKQYSGKYNFFQQIYPKMKKIATDAIKASSLSIDPDRKAHNFQVFGMDFMIDQNFKPWLIEINNNPCLQLSCPYLSQIIPSMVQNSLKICLDSLVPPPSNFQQKRPKFSDNVFETNKFQLVYDSSIDQQRIRKIWQGQKITDEMRQMQDEIDEIFQDDGKQLED